MRQSRLCIYAALMVAASVTASAGSEYDGARHEPAHARVTNTRRLIVKLRAPDDAARAQAQSAGDPVAALAARTRLSLRGLRELSSRMHVLQIEGASAAALDATLARLRADPAVEYAVPDERRYALAVPNDPDFVNQWSLQNVEASAIDAVTAWDTTQGSKGIVIADLDTGVRYEHPDLGAASVGGRLLAGYDFISGDGDGQFLTANDGDGPDDDASDPGDWLTAADLNLPVFNGCGPDPQDSSWHGTRVAGILGALTDNATGVAGLTWDTYILPVRVLGKCGGFDSDIIDGMRWAAGLHVAGAPDNPFPARVENLSLGAVGPCPAAYNDVIDELTALGVLIVASAGNEGGPVKDSPGSCPGVVGVAGLRHAGTKVGFSSLGPEITVSAPAGNCVNTGPGEPCLFSIDTTSNTGTTTPVASTYTDEFNINVGTSFSSPIVAGIAALMASANGNLTTALLTARLQEGAQPFPPNDPALPVCVPPGPVQAIECNCTTTTCGAGMANARASVEAALRPITAIAANGPVVPGQDVTLDGSGSAAACGQSISTYAWTVVSGVGVISSGADAAIAVVIAPATNPFTVRLTVTDDAGRQDFADVIVEPMTTSTDAPADARGVACAVALTIPPPTIEVSADPQVGEDLESGVTITLSDAPLAPVDVTVTIDAPGTALVSDDATVAGAPTVTVSAVADTAPRTVFVQGLALGTATLTVSVPGFVTSTQTVTVDPSGFVIRDVDFSLLSTAVNRSVPVNAARLDPATLAYAETQTLRPGLVVSVPVSSSNTLVGTIVTSPLDFSANVATVQAQFDPVNAGTTTLTVDTPAGFDTPSDMQSITATVTAPVSSGGGGGGGAFDLLSLAALGLLAAIFAARRRAVKSQAPRG